MTRKTARAPVQATYDEEADALTFDLIPPGKSSHTLEIRPDLYIDLDRAGAIVAIEILKASTKYHRTTLRNLPTTGPLITLNEAARIVRLSPATLRKQIHNRRVAATKQGRDWFVSKRDILDYLKTRSQRGRRAAS